MMSHELCILLLIQANYAVCYIRALIPKYFFIYCVKSFWIGADFLSKARWSENIQSVISAW